MTECFACGEIGHTGCVREWKARSDLNLLRAEAAEARIAATLHYVGDPDEWPVPTMAPIMGKVYRLLTGGTE